MSNEVTQLPYATFFPRFISHLWDSIILGVIIVGVYSITGWVRSPSSPWHVVDFSDIDARGQLVVSVLTIITYVIPVAYFIYFEGKDSATPGKKIMHLRIISTEGYYPIGYGKAVLRVIGRVISSAIFSLGYLWILIDEKKQGWHDKIPGTYVVRT